MNIVTANLRITGSQFSPARAEAALGIDMGPEKNEPGDLGTTGPFAGKPLPYGSVNWRPSCNGEWLLPASFTPFHVPKLKERLIELGAETIVLYVYIAHDGQGNFEMGPELLRALSSLGIDVRIHCFPDEVTVNEAGHSP